MKLVVETNVLVSASLWRGAASQLVDALLGGEAILCLSEAILTELADVLGREKFCARLEQFGHSPTTIVVRFREVIKLIEPVKIAMPASLRDADDVHILACAVSAAADAIVTGDQDLLALGMFEGIPIIEVREALSAGNDEAGTNFMTFASSARVPRAPSALANGRCEA